MSVAYVAKSRDLQNWGKEVGVTKNLFLFCSSTGRAENAISALNADSFAGRNDWKLVCKKQTDELEATVLLDRLRANVEMLDPDYYPQLRQAQGIFKVKPEKVEDNLMIKVALQSEDRPIGKIKVGDKEMGLYLLGRATAR